MRLRLAVATLGSLLLFAPAAAHADSQSTTNKGLFITPARAYATVEPGKSTHGTITIANYLEHPQTITLSVEQFTVADYTYDYHFSAPHDDWIKLSLTQTTLEPGKSQQITYTANPPSGTVPGGHYFAIFATAIAADDSSKNEARATTVLYATVKGALSTSSEIKNVSIPQLVFGDIGYDMDVKNTGNTHFFIYTEGSLSNLPTQQDTKNAHLLLPQTVRKVGGTIAAPLLPGIYTATYGYVTETGQTVQRTAHIIYVPWWSVLVVAAIVWIAIILWRRAKRRKGRTFKDSLPRQYT